jgi:putative sigma-54 modulation protein
MQIEYTGHGIDVTDALKTYVKDKFSRLERHFDKMIAAHFTFHVEKLEQIAEATLLVAKTEIHASASAEDMYSAIDSLVDKLDRQLVKHKEKLSDHHRE